MDKHKHWKHVKSGKVATVIGGATYKGGVNETLSDMAEINIIRPVGLDGWADLDVVPGHYTVTNVKTGDSGKLQTEHPVKHGDVLVVYQHDFEVWARPVAEFMDGRFVKVDEQGKELAPAVTAAPEKRKEA